jgi:hypothetical protein
MQELNRKALTDAIQQLPHYEPEEQVWNGISSELDLKDAVQALPQYAPPAGLWSSIEEEISTPAVERKRLPPLRIYIAAAASVALLITAGLFLMDTQKGSNEAITYHKSVVEGQWAYENSWDSDEQDLMAVVYMFKKDPVARQANTYQELLDEWAELNEAKAEIREMMKKYGQDEQLISALGKIERNRSAVVKEMAIQI